MSLLKRNSAAAKNDTQAAAAAPAEGAPAASEPPVEGGVGQAAETVAEPAAGESVADEVEDAVEGAVEDVEKTAEDVVHELVTMGEAVIHMVHPDGGTTDAYEADKNGVIAVPAAEAETMLSHGFVPASDVKGEE